MEVTLDVFSGRPNPSWRLSPEEAEELVRKLEGLPASDRSPAADDLGYRGFVVTGLQGPTGSPSQVHVLGGIVTVRSDQGARSYVDAAEIERWLGDQARRRGYGELLGGG